jgi:hypothetical protein
MKHIVNNTTASVTASINVLPVGTIMPFGGSGVKVAELKPQGWLLCDGAKVSINDYKNLHNVIGNACGNGGGDFYLPDLRSVFLRGVDGADAKNHDPNANARTAQNDGGHTGNEVLTRQGDEFKKHKHKIVESWLRCGVYSMKDSEGGHRFDRTEKRDSETIDLGGDESRPVNVSVNYIIFAGLRTE